MAIQGDPGDTFEDYQAALSISDWETTLAVSDGNTHNYLETLTGWILDSTADVDRLDAFEQFLVTSSRHELLRKNRNTVEPTELLGIWMNALEMRPELIRAEMRNQYYFGGVAIAQLFNSKTHSNTGKKIRFIYESGWRIDAMGLMEAFYDASAYGLGDKFLTESPTTYSERGYLSRHPQMPDNPYPERLTL